MALQSEKMDRVHYSGLIITNFTARSTLEFISELVGHSWMARHHNPICIPRTMYLSPWKHTHYLTTFRKYSSTLATIVIGNEERVGEKSVRILPGGL